MKKLHVVFDNSTLVGAAIRPGSIPDRALSHAILFHRVFLSDRTLDEFSRVLRQSKFDRYVSSNSRAVFLENLQRDSHLFPLSEELIQEVHGICRDSNDDMFLALCLAVRADVLVSSDHDLLILNPWNDILILTPAEFLAQAEGSELRGGESL